MLPQSNLLIIFKLLGSASRWLLPNWAFGLACLFFLLLLLLVD
jgi:hypothetical protein